MKKLVVLISVLALMVLIGCATDRELITKAVSGAGDGALLEVAEAGPIPNGYADLLIVASIKTHKPYPCEDKTHGTPEFRILLNIDGQSTWMQASIKEENIEPRGLRDPEAGDGVRYIFRKHLRLKEGRHKVIVAIPEDVIADEREIGLKGGSANDIILEPVYGIDGARKRPTAYTETSFLKGVRSFRMIFNGKPL